MRILSLCDAAMGKNGFHPTDADFDRIEEVRSQIDFEEVEDAIKNTFRVVFGKERANSISLERIDCDDLEGANTSGVLVDKSLLLFPTLAVIRRPTIGRVINKLDLVWAIDRMVYNPGSRWEPPDTDYENLGCYQNLDDCLRNAVLIFANEILDQHQSVIQPYY